MADVETTLPVKCACGTYAHASTLIIGHPKKWQVACSCGRSSVFTDTALEACAAFRADVKAVNMHDKFTAFVESQKRECQKRQDTGSCEGCFGTIPGGIPCDIRALLKEARGDK